MGRLKTRKKGWKRIPRTFDEQIEEVHTINRLGQLPDDELFLEDSKLPEKSELDDKKLTFRQRAALDYRRQRFEKIVAEIKKEEDPMEVEIGKQKIKSQKVSPKSKQMRLKLADDKNSIKPNKNQEKGYDLWDDSNETEFKVSSRPKRLRTKYIHSALPALTTPHEGTSYNPPLESYMEYVNKIAQEEKRILSSEAKTERRLDLGFVSEALDEGFHYFLEDQVEQNDPKEDEPAQEQEEEGESSSIVKTVSKQKTAKQKRKQLLQKQLEANLQAKKKTQKQRAQEFSSLKSMSKELRRMVTNHNNSVENKRVKRNLKRLITRKRLGRGKFEPELEPVALPNELTSTLRQLKPQGNIFQERLSSLQRRNILPIAGQRQRPTLKKKLRVRFVEKRDVKAITEESRVIN